MHVEDVSISASVEKRDRNWMIRIFSALEQNGDIQIECHREIVLVKDGKKYDTNGDNGERKYLVVKNLSEIINETVTIPDGLGGTITLSARHVALALEALSDKFAESTAS